MIYFLQKQKKTAKILSVKGKDMLDTTSYFKKYLGYEMGTISSSNTQMHDIFYESFRSLDERLLAIHAEDNYPGAIDELGQIALFRDNDVNKAIGYFEKSSAMGNAESSVILSQIYRMEQYGVQDMEKYMKYVRLSAEQGSALGMFNLSCVYHKGKGEYNGAGPDINKEEAVKWAVLGAQRAMQMLKTVFREVRCAKSFSEFASQQYDLAIRCTCSAAETLIDGDGVSKDIDLARRLLNVAKDFFDMLTGQKIDSIEKLLDEIG